MTKFIQVIYPGEDIHLASAKITRDSYPPQNSFAKNLTSRHKICQHNQAQYEHTSKKEPYNMTKLIIIIIRT